ncbi:hypothetical protein AQUCO_02700373v1 [Aquilegia coerulea]|uniref:Protein kinase domain-containing protein n=1 Tax=Aquilegia coerulea TaxID=218851 RepID=A0A2G5D6L7_AQUCA|nr:hypothetical protein AQUCO_02700373v1 [Aquilegia coerulea]
MTNTIYFNLDNASYSTSSPDSILSHHQHDHEGSRAASSSFVVAEEINAWIRPPSCSFGKVFKGWIDEYKLTATKPGRGTAVAVKRLHQGSLQGHEEWLAEINYLGKLYHLNLVKLLGYCLDNQERLLVYEFMPEGSLDNHLFWSNSYCQLSWSIRMKIALGAAKALAFLHSAEVNVIHRGCQNSNILLDWNYNAKLSDFGLARDGPTGDNSHVYTSVMGTYGYACPEYIATGRLTAESDVYSFGVVLLEILSGRRAKDMLWPSNQQNLVDWVMLYLSDNQRIFCLVDSRLDGQYSLEKAQKVVHLAVQCLANKAKLRPNMDVVVTALEQLQESIK